MTKQIALTALGPYASGKNSDFPKLSSSKALSALVEEWKRVPVVGRLNNG